MIDYLCKNRYFCSSNTNLFGLRKKTETESIKRKKGNKENELKYLKIV